LIKFFGCLINISSLIEIIIKVWPARIVPPRGAGWEPDLFNQSWIIYRQLNLLIFLRFLYKRFVYCSTASLICSFFFKSHDRAPIYIKHTLAIRRVILSWKCASLIALTHPRYAPLLINIASSISYGYLISPSPPGRS
jgi:hypothetical protein